MSISYCTFARYTHAGACQFGCMHGHKTDGEGCANLLRHARQDSIEAQSGLKKEVKKVFSERKTLSVHEADLRE